MPSVAGLGYFRNISAYLMFITILLCFGLEITTERQALERCMKPLRRFRDLTQQMLKKLTYLRYEKHLQKTTTSRTNRD